MTEKIPTPKSRQIACRKPLSVVLALVAAIGIGLLDYRTSREIKLSAFYLAPICWLTWNAGRIAGYLISAVCTLIWLFAELSVNYPSANLGIRYWNAFTLLLFFAGFAWLTSALRDSRESLEKTVLQRTAALRGKERELASVIETAAEGIITIDSKGMIETVNRAVKQMFGYESEDLVGQNVSVLLPAVLRESFARGLSGELETDKAIIIGARHETSGQRKDGTEFPIEVALSEYVLEDKRKFVALIRDITVRRRLEAEKMRAERLAMISTMAAGIAHEVRNPLGSMALNLDLIMREIGTLAKTSRHLPKEGGVLVSEMRAEVHRIQHVLDDYLQFARRPKPQRQAVDLGEFLRQKLAFMHSTFEKEGITLRTSFDPSLRTVDADAEQLWQAALNLIRNAIEATPKGGEVMVSTWREGGEARITVKDTGEGMTVEQIQQVGTPFFSTKPKGTGLGLALVQQIMAEHGGGLLYGSHAGQGCTFTLCLPMTKPS